MKRYAITIAILLAATFQIMLAQDEDPVVQAILKEGIEHNMTMNHLDMLCNRFGGRILGSAAYGDAADWCEYIMKSWGLEVWQQECGSLPVGFNRGPWFGRMIGGSNMTLHFTTPSYTAGTKGLQRGHVVKEPRSREEFEKMKGTLKGAWVLIGGESGGWPIDYTPAGDSLRASVLAYNDSIRQVNSSNRIKNRETERMIQELSAAYSKEKSERKKAKLLKETDALKAALIPKIKPKYVPALFYREMVDAGILGIIQSAEVPITTLYDYHVWQMTFETLPTVPDIKLDEAQYKAIEEMVGRREYFQLEFDIRNHFRLGPVKYHNVIAKIEGTEFPDEYVIVGGHLDCFDVATGGVDCGSGASVTLEVARLLAQAGARPKRTILLCLWAGEEFGLLGSKYFVEGMKDEMPKVSNYFNRDGGPTVPVGATVPQAMYDDWCAVAAPLEGVLPFEVKVSTADPRPLPKEAHGSDHAHFAVNGVPTISFDQGDPTGSNFDYDEIWHTERDLYNKSIPENQQNASTITAVIAYGLANLDHLLDRTGLYKTE